MLFSLYRSTLALSPTWLSSQSILFWSPFSANPVHASYASRVSRTPWTPSLNVRPPWLTSTCAKRASFPCSVLDRCPWQMPENPVDRIPQCSGIQIWLTSSYRTSRKRPGVSCRGGLWSWAGFCCMRRCSCRRRSSRSTGFSFRTSCARSGSPLWSSPLSRPSSSRSLLRWCPAFVLLIYFRFIVQRIFQA